MDNGKNQSASPEALNRQIDFAATPTSQPVLNPAPQPTDSTIQSPSPASTSNQKPRLTPVTSAKAAINAMYAASAGARQPKMVTSAREAVNAAASQNSLRNQKSAANLHHGSIQKSMESTRTSASSLLRVAKSEQPTVSPNRQKNSSDPLSRRPQPPAKKSTRSDNSQSISVVRTSLKLGAAARPKSQPVVLPPNSRMAQVAHAVDSPITISPSNRLGQSSAARAPQRLGLTPATPKRRPIDDQIIQPGGLTPAQRRALNPNAGTSLPAIRPAPMVGSAKRRRAIRDPQMLQAPRPGTIKMSPTPASAAALRASRFRAAPKGFATAKPDPISADEAYVISAPPKLHTRRETPPADPRADQLSQDLADLGIADDVNTPRPSTHISGSYDDEFRPQAPYGSQGITPNTSVGDYLQSLPGDKAPIGRLNAEYVASGHGGAASEYTTIKEENTSNYSFSRQAVDPSKPSVPAPVSPFLKSVNVEKRPLSDSTAVMRPVIARPPVPSTPLLPEQSTPATKPAKIAKTKPPKLSRKDKKAQKAKKSQNNQLPSSPNQTVPTRPTVIVPSSRRSKAPLFFLILFTIILGAAVGAAAYLCFFQ